MASKSPYDENDSLSSLENTEGKSYETQINRWRF